MKQLHLGLWAVAALALSFAPAQARQDFMQACRAERLAAREIGKFPADATWNDFVSRRRARQATSDESFTPVAAKHATTRAMAAVKPISGPTPLVRAVVGVGTEREAQSTCPSDVVVWVDLTSEVYRHKGARSYGATKNGGYMCEREAIRQGKRAAKSARRRHP